MSLQSIVKVLGGDLYDGGRRANIPAPNHSAADRSVSLLLEGGRVVVHTFGDGDWKSVLDDLRSRGLIDQANVPVSGSFAVGNRRGGADAGSARERIDTAVGLWEAAVPLGRTLSARHCRLRGVTRDLPGAAALRHLGEAPVSAYRPGRHRRPALLAGVQDPAGRYVAVEVTYLDPNARRASDLRLSRKTVGVAPAGTAVRLDPPAAEMLVAEGARRLDSLGALTRGERRTAGNGLFRAEDSLESPWAHRALQAFYVALHFGSVEAMDRATFEEKTGLRLLDADGDLKASDQLPPMNTFLNRLLALRIGDQNSLFAAFDEILGSILERAAASGLLDRGMEDIVADEVVIVDEEVVRTDAVTGAETRLTRFQVRSRRELTPADGALAGVDRNAMIFAVNAKSGRAALVVQGLTTTNDDDRLIPAVRLVRPEKRSIAPRTGYDESAWEDVGEDAWRAAWEAELAEADPWVSRELVLVSGLLLPIWSSLPDKGASVRRLKAPDGQRWLGRVLDPSQVPRLKLALGLSDTADVVGDGASAARLVLQDGASLALATGLWVRRAKVMDRMRIEVVGAAGQRPVFTALGCFVEIIAHTPRVFVPTDKSEVLTAILAKWPVQTLLPAAA